MKFEVPALPYEKTALQPYVSEKTLRFHYEKHHGDVIKIRARVIRIGHHRSWGVFSYGCRILH